MEPEHIGPESLDANSELLSVVATHLPFVQVTYLGTTENTRSGIVAISGSAPTADRHSYKIIYSGILKAA
jgi:hypothetical protein